jgi:hypothetical protein
MNSNSPAVRDSSGSIHMQHLIHGCKASNTKHCVKQPIALSHLKAGSVALLLALRLADGNLVSHTNA